MKEINELELYIAAHKDFDNSIIPLNVNYTILDKRLLPDTELSDIKNSYSEAYHLYYIWKHLNKHSYVGLCHYRRYLNLPDNINFNEIFNKYDIILPNKTYTGNVYKQLISITNNQHINDCINIITEYYPEYIDDMHTIFNYDSIYAYNIFIMRKTDYNKYCTWVFDILYKMRVNINCFTDDDINAYIDNNKNKYPLFSNNSVNPYFKTHAYMSRWLGCFCERLFNMYILHNNLIPYEVNLLDYSDKI